MMQDYVGMLNSHDAGLKASGTVWVQKSKNALAPSADTNS
jgi:hypothetical protein